MRTPRIQLAPKYFLPALCVLAILATAGSQLPRRNPATRGSGSEIFQEGKTVRVTTKRDGEATHFYVENRELGDVTMTFDMDLHNLRGDVAFPYTATFPPGRTTEAFTLKACDPDQKWEYSYTNYYKLGSNCAQHDDRYIYELPYLPGCKYKVTQGYNGKFSHTGSNQYAIDFQMPEGTLVLAARGGLVVRVKDDSDTGGPSMEYDRYNNYVLIEQDDGTLAHYCHLQKDGVLVLPGQRVEVGDAIAHSGNTGFSSGPHLHFCVFKTRNGKQRVSIPVKFRTSKETATTLLAGHAYRATEMLVSTPRPLATPSGGAIGGAMQIQ